MSKINIFALGGLGEDGKNMYCISINRDIYIVDAGLKHPSDTLLGVDAVIPDFSFISKHKEAIKGIFISHGHDDHIGGLTRLLKIVNVPIYGASFTLEIIKDRSKKEGLNIDKYIFHEVDSSSKLNFNSVEVSFYGITHSIPGSLGIVFDTEDGSIVYSGDFTFDQNVDPIYRTDFKQLSALSGKKVLALLCESIGAENVGYTHLSDNLDYLVSEQFYKNNNRIIVSLYSDDLARLQKVIDIALKFNRKIVLIGRKTQRFIDLGINEGYLKIPEDQLVNLRFIDDKNNNNYPDSVVIVAGARHEPFFMLQRMVKKIDRLIHIDEKDTVLIMNPPVPGTESIASRTLDELYRHDITVKKIDKKLLPTSHASSEDIKLLVNMLNPLYVVPIIGEYRHQYALKNVVTSLGYESDKVVVLDNGEIASFDGGTLVSKLKSIPVSETLVDGSIEDDLNEVVLRDRELLSQDGIFMIIANVDPRGRRVLSKPEIVSRGFIYVKDNEELIEKVIEKFYEVTVEIFAGKYVDWKVYKDKVKREVSRILYNSTKRNPIVVPVLIDTNI